MDPVVRDIARKLRFDSRETAIFARELEHVQSETYDIEYPALKARSLLPGSAHASNADTTITYRQWDKFGFAKVISNFAMDLPKVTLSGKEYTSQIKSIGIAYDYTINDIRAAVKTGRPLDRQKAEAAREFIERGIDDIAAFGIPEAGMPGFTNHPNVPVVSLPTGTWSGASAALILADLAYLVQQIITNSMGTIEPDTIVFDQTTWGIVSQTIAGANLDTTILKSFLAQNPYIKNAEQWVKLNTAGADAGPRIICYKRDPKIVELEVPQEFEQFPPQAKNMAFDVNCHARVGGILLRYPLGCAYADNAA